MTSRHFVDANTQNFVSGICNPLLTSQCFYLFSNTVHTMPCPSSYSDVRGLQGIYQWPSHVMVTCHGLQHSFPFCLQAICYLCFMIPASFFAWWECWTWAGHISNTSLKKSYNHFYSSNWLHGLWWSFEVTRTVMVRIGWDFTHRFIQFFNQFPVFSRCWWKGEITLKKQYQVFSEFLLPSRSNALKDCYRLHHMTIIAKQSQLHR